MFEHPNAQTTTTTAEKKKGTRPQYTATTYSHSRGKLVQVGAIWPREVTIKNGDNAGKETTVFNIQHRDIRGGKASAWLLDEFKTTKNGGLIVAENVGQNEGQNIDCVIAVSGTGKNGKAYKALDVFVSYLPKPIRFFEANFEDKDSEDSSDDTVEAPAEPTGVSVKDAVTGADGDMSVEDILEATGLPEAQVRKELEQLEADGHIVQSALDVYASA